MNKIANNWEKIYKDSNCNAASPKVWGATIIAIILGSVALLAAILQLGNKEIDNKLRSMK